MNRRDFLRKTAVAALMATPAMKAAAFCRDFGSPGMTTTTFTVGQIQPEDVVRLYIQEGSNAKWRLIEQYAVRRYGEAYSAVFEKPITVSAGGTLKTTWTISP